MVISVLMMCAGSLLIGMLPTYETVGTLAPVLLLIARMIQGLSVGGEYGTSATYMSEVAIDGQRGFFASFQYVTLIGGQLLASLVLVVLQALMTADSCSAWGWRIPFFIGAARRRRRALPAARAGRDAESRSAREQGSRHAAGAVRNHWRALLHRARLHGRRLAELLHVHHLHAEVPGQHRAAWRRHSPRR